MKTWLSLSLSCALCLFSLVPAGAEIVRSGFFEGDMSDLTPNPPAVPFAAGSNILTNPGFESGSLPPWTTTNWAVTSADANSGTYSAEDIGNFWVMQSFAPVSVGAINSITMWSRQPEPTIQAVDFFYSAVDFDEFLVFPGANWTFHDMTSQLRAAGNLEAIRIWGYSGGGPDEDLTRVDDVAIDAEGANATDTGTWGRIKGMYR
jgi:hypothetical protein